MLSLFVGESWFVCLSFFWSFWLLVYFNGFFFAILPIHKKNKKIKKSILLKSNKKGFVPFQISI